MLLFWRRRMSNDFFGCKNKRAYNVLKTYSLALSLYYTTTSIKAHMCGIGYCTKCSKIAKKWSFGKSHCLPQRVWNQHLLRKKNRMDQWIKISKNVDLSSWHIRATTRIGILCIHLLLLHYFLILKHCVPHTGVGAS